MSISNLRANYAITSKHSKVVSEGFPQISGTNTTTSVSGLQETGPVKQIRTDKTTWLTEITLSPNCWRVSIAWRPKRTEVLSLCCSSWRTMPWRETTVWISKLCTIRCSPRSPKCLLTNYTGGLSWVPDYENRPVVVAISFASNIDLRKELIFQEIYKGFIELHGGD